MPRLSLIFIISFIGTVDLHAEEAFTFLATGDLPYSAEQESNFRKLLKQSESEDFDFLMHVGDFKGGSAPCTDESFIKIRDLFRQYPKPVVYTPGDNEWTDCNRTTSDPLERLQKIRELFYQDRSTLRLAKLKTIHQGKPQQRQQRTFSKYVENYRFTKSRVMFIVVHIVGSKNNYEGGPAARREFEERNKANIAFLVQSLAEAVKADAPGIAIVIHANPNFETDTPPYVEFLNTTRDFLAKYKKPVVCIHGDTHTYRVDQPLRNRDGQVIQHFTRMEVFGAPAVAAVKVHVKPDSKRIFAFEPYYLKTN